MKARSNFLNILVTALLLVTASGFTAGCGGNGGGGGSGGSGCVDDILDFTDTVTDPGAIDFVVCESVESTGEVDNPVDFVDFVGFEATSAGTYDIKLFNYEFRTNNSESVSASFTANDVLGNQITISPVVSSGADVVLSYSMTENEGIILNIALLTGPDGIVDYSIVIDKQ